MKIIVKYGGTSISTAKQIKNIAKFVTDLHKTNHVVIVCSAVKEVTDNLIEISQMINKGNKQEANKIVTKIITSHKKLVQETITKSQNKKKLLDTLKQDFSELSALVDGMALLGEITPRSMDYLLSFGERLSLKIITHAIIDLGKKSQGFTGSDIGIVTDSNFGESKPLMDTTKLIVSKTIDSLFAKKILAVIGGFTGADQHGRITTFGRGGSDYTATIIASCIKADEIWLMSEVDGLMTTDPKIVKNTKILKEVSYAEAMEMAMFGAKQIHPRTFEPLLSKKPPIRIRSSSNTTNKGTLITASPAPETKKTVKCVSVMRHNELIDIRGGSMVGSPGTAAKIFDTLAKVGVNVMMISQNPSESSITIVVKSTDLDRAVNVLEMELLGKIIKKLEVTTNVAIVALIGSGMRGTIGVASRVFGSMAKKNINVVMITQGSSELNLALVVKDADAKGAVTALHDEFELAKIN
jgi:aspartate kinase